ncbi:hypothetical protein BS50DRAFT_522785 [Corynespora cassiicola Philippines]|uniref:Uncharacterized protein n=1 Tax=Corynespora cassiicola Philippines TaxID=1448308 RepID=A0A2T2NRA0_CORCC|nr:hypothetical protein BS50DRAFT_522785 [Corynespora cassiicola Philippines]
MADEIVLYDLACTKNICFSPVVWRIRLMLNYKQIPYKTIFLEFPDIEPTLKELGIVPDESAAGTMIKYTVPAIHHLPTSTYLMDSIPIAQFIESTYPDPPVPLASDIGNSITARARGVVGTAFGNSVMPREPDILSPRAQEYFRRTREAMIGHRLEDLLDKQKEDEAWSSIDDDIRAVGEMMQTHKAEGPFVLGAHPSLTDFFIAGVLQSARTVSKEVFERIIIYPGFKEVFEACQPYMEKDD